MKVLRFTDETSKGSLEIKIPEVLDPSYGMYVWPCAPVLAQYIWHHRNIVAGKCVLELGAGTALPGVVAAKVGAKVTLSDGADLPRSLDNCRASLEANDVKDVTVTSLTWGQFGPDILALQPVDIIIGSDCFYESKDFEDILVTVSFLMEKNPHAEFWTTYQQRSSDRCIIDLLEKWKLTVECIELSEFGGDRFVNSMDQDSTEDSFHTIIMYKISRNS